MTRFSFRDKRLFEIIEVDIIGVDCIQVRRACASYTTLNMNLQEFLICFLPCQFELLRPGRVAQSVGHLTRKTGVLASIPGLATYFRFSFRFFKKGSCQLLAKVCARSTD